MKNDDVWFVIVAYKPDEFTLARLKTALADWPVITCDNTETNVGFGAAANRGMEEAFSAGATWTVVCNQDIQMMRKGAAQFCAAVRKSPPGIAGPQAGSLDPRRWTTVLPARGSVAYVSGSMMAIHRDVWETVGGFYEPYFMYYEDADLCVRAERAGFVLTCVPVEGFAHVPHANAWYLARNHLLFVWRLAPLTVKLYELLRLPKTLFELL